MGCSSFQHWRFLLQLLFSLAGTLTANHWQTPDCCLEQSGNLLLTFTSTVILRLGPHQDPCSYLCSFQDHLICLEIGSPLQPHYWVVCWVNCCWLLPVEPVLVPGPTGLNDHISLSRHLWSHSFLPVGQNSMVPRSGMNFKERGNIIIQTLIKQ